ncbi:hypothetical protein D1627_07305 [Pontibacter oryzae]|uniref:Uncharacterized protein n=2 Tax=Pontibacter oryzae TaxID=2304593 RepID=A0A399SCL5_9BACT|nr:hypothetical protein D1627_07305 [Pontibacter oryzae]
MIYMAANAQKMRVTDDDLDLVVLSMDMDGTEMANLEMRQELNLSEEQYVQVAQLNSFRYEQLEHADKTFAKNPLQRSKEFRSINLTNDKRLQDVLSADQLQAYQKMEGRFSMQFVSENDEN